MSTLKPAILASALHDQPRNAIAMSRESGFAGLLFDAYGKGFSIPDLSGTGRREFRQVLAAHNQSLVGLRADLGPKGFAPGADVDRLLDGLDRALEAAASLLSPLVCVDLGPLPEPARAAAPKPLVTSQQAGLIFLPEYVPPAEESPASPPPDPAFVSQVDAAMSELGNKAERYRVIVAFRTDLASFAALHGALDRVRCPWFGIDLDATAILADAWSVDEIFSGVGSLVRHVRGRDATVGAARRTKPAPLGRGNTDWRQILGNLDGVGYTGWLTIDPMELPDRRAAAIAALEFLKGLG